MLDVNFIRKNPEAVKKAAQDKDIDVNVDLFLEKDKEFRQIGQELEELLAERKKLSKEKGGDGFDIEKKKKVKELKSSLKTIEDERFQLQQNIPSIPKPDVKIGKSEQDNEVIRTVGEPVPFDFAPKDSTELGESLDLIDTDRAGKVSGPRFGYLKNEAVLLEFALVQYAFDKLTKEGFQPIIPPVLIKEKAMRGMGYLEHGEDQETYLLPKDDLYLVGTSEQSIGPYHMDEILLEKELPKRYVAFSTCFRREAGSYGKDTRGILRVHQFDKVEMYSLTTPKKSDEEHELFLKYEEELVQALKIPYQVVKMCTADLGAQTARKYDIECWIPSEKAYRETHSASTCTDFQSRRLKIRYKTKKGNDFVHTVNGTAFAIGRMLIAIIENYQTKEGTVIIPEVLQKYLPNIQEIKSK